MRLEEEEWGEGGMEGLGEGFGGDACVHTPTDPRPRGRKEKKRKEATDVDAEDSKKKEKKKKQKRDTQNDTKGEPEVRTLCLNSSFCFADSSFQGVK